MKKFGKGINRGEVKRYKGNIKYYWINYNNGGLKEMSQKQIKRFKFIDNNLGSKSSLEVPSNKIQCI